MNYEYINTIPSPLLPETNETYPNDEMLEMARNQSIPQAVKKANVYKTSAYPINHKKIEVVTQPNIPKYNTSILRSCRIAI